VVVWYGVSNDFVPRAGCRLGRGLSLNLSDYPPGTKVTG
jgi:hypothetical protein